MLVERKADLRFWTGPRPSNSRASTTNRSAQRAGCVNSYTPLAFFVLGQPQLPIAVRSRDFIAHRPFCWQPTSVADR